MTDAPAPGTKEANDLVVHDKNGDPVADPLAVRMIEKESYERVIEGLRMVADSCAHQAFIHRTLGLDAQGMRWAERAIGIDKVRMTAVVLAGLEDRNRHRGTEEIRRNPMSLKDAKKRLSEGFAQSAGGCRQMATCQRGQMEWSLMANMLDDMEHNWRTPKRSRIVLPHLH